MSEKNQELEDLLQEVDKFSTAMKQRLIERASKGVTGWKDVTSEHSCYQIQKVSTELILNPKKDVDVANWCLIHWVNRKL